MIRTQVQLDQEQMARLRRLAAERGVSISSLIRQAVDEHLGEEPQDARWERAVRSIGGFHSGKSDVSEDHDHYLAEDFAPE